MSPIYGEAYTVLWLYQAIGTIIDLIDEWTGSLQDQVLPQTATWSIPYWEKQYGIISDPSLSTEQRRINILQKFRTKGQINPKRMEDLITDIVGYATKIYENTGKNKFRVAIRGNVEDLADIHALVKEMKPAHLIYDIIIAEIVNLNHDTISVMTMWEREKQIIEVYLSYIYNIYLSTILDENGHIICKEDEMRVYLDAEYSINTDTGVLSVENGTYMNLNMDENGHIWLEIE
ncbi:MAG: DUF2313 domain-containing protein [Bacteroidaceae bacterium]|nr:DUF2313 domain-containing protein [Bacteroidaceae bacterium]